MHCFVQAGYRPRAAPGHVFDVVCLIEDQHGALGVHVGRAADDGVKQVAGAQGGGQRCVGWSEEWVAAIRRHTPASVQEKSTWWWEAAAPVWAEHQVCGGGQVAGCIVGAPPVAAPHPGQILHVVHLRVMGSKAPLKRVHIQSHELPRQIERRRLRLMRPAGATSLTHPRVRMRDGHRLLRKPAAAPVLHHLVARRVHAAGRALRRGVDAVVRPRALRRRVRARQRSHR